MLKRTVDWSENQHASITELSIKKDPQIISTRLNEKLLSNAPNGIGLTQNRII